MQTATVSTPRQAMVRCVSIAELGNKDTIESTDVQMSAPDNFFVKRMVYTKFVEFFTAVRIYLLML